MSEDNWFPIESAPNDGTKIFIWREGWPFAAVAKWGEQDDADGVFFGWHLEDQLYIPGSCAGGFVGWEEDIQDGHMPTHWQPLPHCSAQTAEDVSRD